MIVPIESPFRPRHESWLYVRLSAHPWRFTTVLSPQEKIHRQQHEIQVRQLEPWHGKWPEAAPMTFPPAPVPANRADTLPYLDFRRQHHEQGPISSRRYKNRPTQADRLYERTALKGRGLRQRRRPFSGNPIATGTSRAKAPTFTACRFTEHMESSKNPASGRCRSAPHLNFPNNRFYFSDFSSKLPSARHSPITFSIAPTKPATLRPRPLHRVVFQKWKRLFSAFPFSSDFFRLLYCNIPQIINASPPRLSSFPARTSEKRESLP